MPRKQGHVPGYRLHKPSGQARVIIDGQHVYLGRFGSPESREKYARVVDATRRENIRAIRLVNPSRLDPFEGEFHHG